MSLSQDFLQMHMRHLRDFHFGELEPSEFDRWLCQAECMEDAIGDEAFSALMNADYSDRDQIEFARHVVARVYRERLHGDLVRDRVHDVLEGMLGGTISLRSGCVYLWEMRLGGASFIPAVFAGYASELERTGDEEFYRERILRGVQEFLHDFEPEG